MVHTASMAQKKKKKQQNKSSLDTIFPLKVIYKQINITFHAEFQSMAQLNSSEI